MLLFLLLLLPLLRRRRRSFSVAQIGFCAQIVFSFAFFLSAAQELVFCVQLVFSFDFLLCCAIVFPFEAGWESGPAGRKTKKNIRPKTGEKDRIARKKSPTENRITRTEDRFTRQKYPTE